MLVDQKNSNILPLRRESLECFLDSCIIGFAVYYQEVLLRVRRLGNMLEMISPTTGNRVILEFIRQCLPGAAQ